MTDDPLLAEALIRTRDAIAGSWQPWAPAPAAAWQLPLEDPDQLERWQPDVRLAVLDFELFSRLGFAASQPVAAGPPAMKVWHLSVDSSAAADPPSLSYRPLVAMVRPTEAIFLAQLDLVHEYCDVRPDRAAEVLTQTGSPAAFLGALAYLHPIRTRWTLELLDVAYRLCRFVHFRLKHALAVRRPVELSAQLQPFIQTPGHGSLPSGHATEAFTTAAVLLNLLRDSGQLDYPGTTIARQLMRLAARIAVNRTVGGVHFPVDSAAGALLGFTLAQYLTARAAPPPAAPAAVSYRAWQFDGPAHPEHGDFVWSDMIDADTTPPTLVAPLPAFVADLGAVALTAEDHAPLVAWLWGKAKAEWA